MRIDLLRHGACSGGSIFRGQIDVPLTDEGWAQMTRGLEELAGSWDRIVTSPLGRCQAFAAQLGFDKKLPVRSSSGIREIGFGEWEGQSVDKIWTEQQALCDAWSREPDKYSPQVANLLQLLSPGYYRLLASWLFATRENPCYW
ncbi:hypothetical protein GL2_37300 [Microbulbifer sp. GL-2]|nr:histidine phosphatase family protein [Microbulbifer sp. GL-2]BBM03656.1 hypothetical protein GL2_37300 [Microbulbifer sp. GL-2]